MKVNRRILKKDKDYILNDIIVRLADDWVIIGHCSPTQHYRIGKINEALHELKCPARLIISRGKLVVMLKRENIFDYGVDFEPGIMIDLKGENANVECCNTNMSILTLFIR